MALVTVADWQDKVYRIMYSMEKAYGTYNIYAWQLKGLIQDGDILEIVRQYEAWKPGFEARGSDMGQHGNSYPPPLQPVKSEFQVGGNDSLTKRS